jgi:Regulator of chromosome condensation (RCC1) repeat
MSMGSGRGWRGILVAGLWLMATWSLPAWAQGHNEGAVPDGRGGVVALAVGPGHACGIDERGEASCWGPSPVAHEVTPPAGPFIAVSAGEEVTCGLRADGTPVCWGLWSPLLDAPAPQGQFTALTVGDAHACVIRADGEVLCWGTNYYGESSPPTGRFIALTAGKSFTCGLRDDGNAECWGIQGTGETAAPPGAFIALSAGAHHSCGLRSSGHVDCWGDREWRVPAATFTAIAAGIDYTCGLLESGQVQCWGADGISATQPEDYLAMSTAGHWTCGLRTDGSVQCWSRWGGYAESPMPPRKFGFGVIDATHMHTCQARPDGTLGCWGNNSDGQASERPGFFNEIAAGERFTCARDGHGEVQCWGADFEQQLQSPREPLRQITAGRAHACALKSIGGEAVCWGWNSNGQATAPAGWFKNLGAGLAHTCGTTETGDGQCWGYNGDGQTDVPAEPLGAHWLSVQAGARQSCGLGSDGLIECWGFNPEVTPTGFFRALSVGNNHSCAIRTDGRLACWGGNWAGQTNAPEGTFVAVTTGEQHSCAIRTDGARLCWGATWEAPQLGLEPGYLPGVGLNQYFYASFWAQSFSPNYSPIDTRFALVAGTLPEGFRLDANGYLTGPAMQEGRFPITVEGRDRNGFVATRDYTIVIDGSVPLIQPMVTGPLGDNGWYVGDVSVDWLVTDPESEMVWTTGCEHQDIRFDVPQLPLHCMADSVGGHAEQMLDLKRDATAPHTLMRNAVTEAGTARFEFAGDDGMSGIAGFECRLDDAAFEACASPLVLNVTSGPHRFTARAVDAAGNRDPWPAPHIWTADATPPVIDAFVHGEQRRGEGWYTGDVTIDWPVFDPESPVTSTTGCEPVTLASDAIGASFTCTATSNGGTSSKTVTVKRDATAPVIVAAANTAPNATGWYNHGVEVTFSCSDATSGIEHCEDRMEWLDGEGTLTSNPHPALDVAGNDAISNVVTVKIDHTPPTLAPTVSSSTLLLNGTATASANGNDALSGIAAQSCDPLATGSVGDKTVDCTAIDRAGNPAGGSAGYRVVYGFAGFTTPVQNPPVLNVFKAGRSIPLRWRVVDAQGAPVTNLASATVTATTISCPSATENRISTYGGGSSQLQNLGNGYYQLDWMAASSLRGYCRRLDLNLGDGQSHPAQFKFN